MRVFVTGATGFIGSAIVRELIDAGHQVVGLARSDASAAALSAVGAEAHRGSLDDLDSLRGAAAATDGVIHTAFVHDFSDYVAAADTDRRAIEAIGETLAESDRPLVVASGMAALTPGRLATEEDAVNPNLPRLSEQTVLPFAERGVRVSVLRLPPSVHGEGDHGFVPHLINTARAKGVSVYPGDGSNRWPAVHRLDAAQLFRLALEDAPAGARLHAVGDEGVAVRDIAEVIGRHLDVAVNSIPAETAFDHLGFIGAIFAMEMGASSALTQTKMNWHPSRPGLIEDLDKGHYFELG
jgi:nucleoside-diphosphate-sugar epimerase